MELFQKYSITSIIQFIVLFALAVKGFVSFLEWIFPRLRKTIKRVDQPILNENALRQQAEQIANIKESINKLAKMINTLIQSDRDDIKAYITREHHFFVYQKGWIDDYSLDCIERRYSHYVEQGGNSFIKGLMGEIRRLPKKQTGQN